MAKPETDEQRRDRALKRMLETPPKPHGKAVKDSETKPPDEEETGGRPENEPPETPRSKT